MAFKIIKLCKPCSTQCYITRAFGSSLSRISTAFKYSGDEKHLARNPNKSGPLTDLPDYSFLNGRVTPLGARQTKRLLQQQEIANKIVTMSKEMDYAVERYKSLQEEKQNRNKKIVSNYLKPKGFALLSK
ncbi:39S ribosomal protein L52, mitochondrial [Aedes aegypti]|uniref:Large ribosomal subunit protein mL52 n=1 Tax=Aedes aegypti TaxID=7159 RepID=Q1HQF0_AEDAE|nr:39S ribosomal protein L52, mitochondrial [Aedes aegypti]ABF18527.1 mitochondrial ribosomal protein L52 [Aedes aegypti]